MISWEGCTWASSRGWRSDVKVNPYGDSSCRLPLLLCLALIYDLVLSFNNHPCRGHGHILSSFCEPLHFALNYGKVADAKCIWMPLNRTGTLFSLFGCVISLICVIQPNTAYPCVSFYYARKQTTHRNSPRILIGTTANCARKWRW